MGNRRYFLKTTGLAAGAVLAGGAPVVARAFRGEEFISNRPALKDRHFVSEAVEATIQEVKGAIRNPEIAWLFENCYPNTLDTTVRHQMINGRPDTFVITGDIDAMWLRDSSAQVWPYLALASKDKALKQLLAGVVNRQTACILIDPYANAFNDGPGESPWLEDLTDMKPELHERKWEVDSLCYPIRLAYGYWKVTKDDSVFTPEWIKAMGLVLQTFREQQRKNSRGPYRFQRVTSWQTDTVPGGGYGNPIRPVGLICSIFRPSDDATIYPFLIPSNLFAITSLRQLAEIFDALGKESAMAAESRQLADEVEKALYQYAVAERTGYGKMFAYEVDGYGNQLFMDDANVPSLLAIPYLTTINAEDQLYRNTRKFVLSRDNPWFFRGPLAEGVGGPHTLIDKIWPMSIIMRAHTSIDPNEIKACLEMLRATHAGTGFMHESFHREDPAQFTRKWFAWANTLFGELVVNLHEKNPDLL